MFYLLFLHDTMTAVRNGGADESHAAGGATDEGTWLPVFTPHPPIDVNSKSGM
ncbi:unnamed protein product [Brugia timori]|uniref:Uncharacterized protein n=1 Tax=Brugia timori TaxID=42155 RepID=A0A0R3R4A0_9BILA|nr:unnamed protein product [Brugia timori]